MKKRTITIYLLLGLALLALAVLNIHTGSVSLSPGEILRIIFTGDRSQQSGVIIWNLRVPRVAAAILLGGALSISGFLLQTFFSNPIAGPYILGVSSGAKLVVACVMIIMLGHGMVIGSLGMIASAFVGSLAVMGFVLAIATRVKTMSILIVCGVMVGYICSAVTEFMITFADDSNIINLHNWSMGSFSGITWSNVRAIAIVVLAGAVLAFLMSKSMSAFQLGENYAKSVGVNMRAFRIKLILLSSVLSATVTAFAGPVSFVGIAVPHLARMVFKTSKPIVLIPGAFLGGAVFCLLCDLLARNLFAPTEMSISTITAVFGAPIVIAMLIRRKK